MFLYVPSRGVEPLSQAPQAGILSIELRGQDNTILSGFVLKSN